MASRLDILTRVADERARQIYMYDHGELAWICSSPSNIASIEQKLVKLGEEYGEACQAHNKNQGNKRVIEELIQVAAVAVGIVESLENEI